MYCSWARFAELKDVTNTHTTSILRYVYLCKTLTRGHACSYLGLISVLFKITENHCDNISKLMGIIISLSKKLLCNKYLIMITAD